MIPLYATFATLQARLHVHHACARERQRHRSEPGDAIDREQSFGIHRGEGGRDRRGDPAGERIWKKSRVAAVIFVAAANGAVAAIVARNYSVR
jgi:hypothetical protein